MEKSLPGSSLVTNTTIGNEECILKFIPSDSRGMDLSIFDKGYFFFRQFVKLVN